MLTLERILLLKKVSLFEGMHIHELRLIADIVQETEAEEGEVLFNQGEPGDSMYMILEGQVQLVLADGTVFKTLAAFEAFGEMALLNDEPRSVTARAGAPCKFLRIERDEFLEVLIQYPTIAIGLLRMMSRRLRSELPTAAPAQSNEAAGMAFRQ